MIYCNPSRDRAIVPAGLRGPALIKMAIAKIGTSRLPGGTIVPIGSCNPRVPKSASTVG